MASVVQRAACSLREDITAVLTSHLVCAHTNFMALVSEYSRPCTSSPAAVFPLWADPRSWPEWDPEVRHVEFGAVTAIGSRGRLTPSSGPALRFSITDLLPNELFTNTSALPGARLEFEHRVTASQQGSVVTVAIRTRGPLAKLWSRLLKKPMSGAAQSSVDGLIGHLGRQA